MHYLSIVHNNSNSLFVTMPVNVLCFEGIGHLFF